MTRLLETDFVRGDPEASYKHFVAKVAPSVDPDAVIDVACFMTTDAVDGDGEVMLPDGGDLSRFDKNPVVMLCHAMGQPGCYYPLPVGKAEWTKKRPRGVMAGVRFTEKSPMGREVKALFEDDMLRSFSVGFKPVEFSPMTFDEANSRPDWKAAYEKAKGRIGVHRKWHLLELSVAPVPSNPDALVVRYKSKGILVPDWLRLAAPKPEAKTMLDATEAAAPGGDIEVTPEATVNKAAVAPVIKCAMGKALSLGSHVRDIGSGMCGDVKALHTEGSHPFDSEGEHEGEIEASEDNPVAHVHQHDDEHRRTKRVFALHAKGLASIPDDEDDDTEGKALGTLETKAAKPAAEPEPKGEMSPDGEGEEVAEDMDEDDENTEAAGFRRGHHVAIKAPHYRGVGVVKSIHRKGHVPNVPNDVMGTQDEPAARVQCYKAMDDGHDPTVHHVGVKCKHLAPMAEEMKAPTTKAAPAPTTKAKGKAQAAIAVEPLPPLVALSDQELQLRAVKAIEGLPMAINAELDRRMGCI